MLIDRYPAEDVFARVPELANQADPVLMQLDRLLEDDLLFQQVRADLVRRHRLTAVHGRHSTPAEALLRQAERETPPSPSSLPETVKQQAAPNSRGEANLPPAEATEADERQAQLRAIASDLLYWKGGLKVLRQAQLPTWRGYFKWQIEAKIETLQTAYARVRAEVANRGE